MCEQALPDIEKNLERMHKLQCLLYADGDQSPLIVLQVLDEAVSDRAVAGAADSRVLRATMSHSDRDSLMPRHSNAAYGILALTKSGHLSRHRERMRFESVG